MAEPSICVVGTMHMDFIVYTDRLPKPGETVIGRGFEMQPGGKGANQAVAAARLGARSSLVSRVGDDYVGRLLLENAARNGVDTSHVRVDPESHSGVALIIVGERGENVIAVAPGVDLRISPGDVEAALPAIRSADAVLAQLEIPVETALRAMRLAKQWGRLAILNPAPAKPLPEDAFSCIDVITPNVRELEALTGASVESVEDAVEAAHLLLERGVGAVVVTMGKRGALVVDGSGSRLVPTFDVPVVDTVGAGDAFNGALAVALSLGASIDEAATFGNLVASLKVTKRGAQAGLPRLEEVEKFAEERGARFSFLNRLRRAYPSAP
ncbi:MAG: ribokinase [Thermofilaceae archaeon]